MRRLRVDEARLEDPDRQAAAADLLDSRTDAQLQELVVRAAALTGFPIALVTLVLKRTQFFKAHVGLPDELQLTGSTERCASFCQFAVSNGETLEISNTADHPELPTALGAYGLKAYAGVPLRHRSQVVGTLCVIHVTPQQLTPEILEQLQHLAQKVESRLLELATPEVSPTLTRMAAQPSFSELRNQLMVLQNHAVEARIAAHEQRGLLNLLASAQQGRIGWEALQSALAASTESFRAADDLQQAVDIIASTAKRITRSVVALEGLLELEPSRPSKLEDAIKLAAHAAHHITKLVGGVSWQPLSPELRSRACPPHWVTCASLALVEMGKTFAGQRSGIQAELRSREPAHLELFLTTPQEDLDKYFQVGAELAKLLADRCQVRASQSGVCLAFG